jgi:hypothetical protein
MKLTQQHLAAYLPYKVKGILIKDLRENYQELEWVDDIDKFNEGAIWELVGIVDEDLMIPLGEGYIDSPVWSNRTTYTCFNENEIKLLLHPIESITKKIEFDGETFKPIEKIYEMYGQTLESKDFKLLRITDSYVLVKQLLKWHIDIFNLIPNNLALCKNK